MGMGVAGRNDILPDVEQGFALGQKVKFEIWFSDPTWFWPLSLSELLATAVDEGLTFLNLPDLK